MRERTVIHRVWSQHIKTWKFYYSVLLLLSTVYSTKTDEFTHTEVDPNSFFLFRHKHRYPAHDITEERYTTCISQPWQQFLGSNMEMDQQKQPKSYILVKIMNRCDLMYYKAGYTSLSPNYLYSATLDIYCVSTSKSYAQQFLGCNIEMDQCTVSSPNHMVLESLG